MSRFFRSALFPLIVIVLLAYLASHTLLRGSDDTKKITYSQLIEQVERGEVKEVLFVPKSRAIEGKLADGEKFKVNYPSDQSQIALEERLREHDVLFDSTGTGDSPWW